MANELLGIESRSGAAGSLIHTIMFLYTISSPITVNGTNVVPTPTTIDGASVLPDIVSDHNLLTAGEITALDSGTMAYELTNITQNEGTTNAELLAAAQAKHAIMQANYIVDYNIKYSLSGIRRDAT